MYCPKCKTHYREGYTVCPDCNTSLIDPPQEETISKEEIYAMDPVHLCSCDNAVNAELIVNLLKNNGIACYQKDNGSGSYMNLYMGYSIYGRELYVDKNDYDRAKELVDLTNEPVSQEDIPEFSAEQVPGLKRALAGKLIILGILVIYLVVFIINNYF